MDCCVNSRCDRSRLLQYGAGSHGDNYPDPRLDHSRCGRPQASGLCDPNHMLGNSMATLIENEIQNTCRETKCACAADNICISAEPHGFCRGVTLTVAIQKKTWPSIIRNPAFDLQLSTIEVGELLHLADKIRANLALTSKCDDDVLLLLSADTNKLVTSVGKNVRNYVTPDCVQAVQKDVQLNITHGRLGDALLYAVRAYKDILKGDFKCKIQFDPVLPTAHVIAIIYASLCLPMLACVLTMFLGPCFRGRGFGGSTHRTHFNPT